MTDSSSSSDIAAMPSAIVSAGSPCHHLAQQSQVERCPYWFHTGCHNYPVTVSVDFPTGSDWGLIWDWYPALRRGFFVTGPLSTPDPADE